MSFKATIIVPTIRQERIDQFLDAWQADLAGHHIIIVEDSDVQTLKIRRENVTVYARADVERELGQNAWIISQRTAAVGNFGFWKAKFDQPDMIVMLHDDCLPADEPGNFLADHFKALSTEFESPSWLSTGLGWQPRGMPYFQTTRKRRCFFNHGLWKGVPDFDATTELLSGRLNRSNLIVFPDFMPHLDLTPPSGMYIPMSDMNIAFHPSLLPAIYLAPMGKGLPYWRFEDIWMGVVVKKIADHLGFAVHSGLPLVDHPRVSNVWQNLRGEAATMETHEEFWNAVDRIILGSQTLTGCVDEIAEAILDFPFGEPGYFDHYGRALRIWNRLCSA